MRGSSNIRKEISRIEEEMSCLEDKKENLEHRLSRYNTKRNNKLFRKRMRDPIQRMSRTFMKNITKALYNE